MEMKRVSDGRGGGGLGGTGRKWETGMDWGNWETGRTGWDGVGGTGRDWDQQERPTENQKLLGQLRLAVGNWEHWENWDWWGELGSVGRVNMNWDWLGELGL